MSNSLFILWNEKFYIEVILSTDEIRLGRIQCQSAANKTKSPMKE